MTDNQLNTPSAFALPDHGVIALEGPDAVAFAQAQFANDVAALPVGQWQWNAWLTPKGRVIALFALLRPTEDRILLLVPDYPAAMLAEQLRRFVFRRKLKIEVRDDLSVQGRFAQPARATGAELEQAADAIELDFGADGGARSLRIASSTAAADVPAITRWFAFDLAHGLPRLAESQRGQWTPQQLSLERLPAFSVRKGCYPGQEIVARTHFLGQAKRGLAALCAAVPIPPDADVELDGSSIGRIVCTMPTEPCLALAVLPLQRGPGALRAAGLGLNDIGLRDGLQR